MNLERWQDIKQKIHDTCTVIDSYQEDLNPGHAEVIEFSSPMGKLRARFNTKPKVLEKKTLYSHRAGGDVKVDYTYSDEDEVSYLTLEKFDENTGMWTTLNAQSLF